MDVIEAHRRRLPSVDGRWTPRSHARPRLESGLLEGKVAGRAAHSLENVRDNIEELLAGNPDKQFGMSFVGGAFDFAQVLQLVSNAAGSPIDEVARRGDVWIEPGTILDECEVLGDRLARAASRGEAFVVATGHPTGLALLYREIAKLMEDHGAKVLRLADGALWEDHHSGGWRQIRYLDGVGMVTDASSPKHTHAPHAMERMLDEGRPDLVLGDHGLAGAAIEVGIDTVSVADVNDPSLIVAKAVGRTEVVVVMDDNVAPDAYWPCFQMIASRFS